jgi:hypothetical protein
VLAACVRLRRDACGEGSRGSLYCDNGSIVLLAVTLRALIIGVALPSTRRASLLAGSTQVANGIRALLDTVSLRLRNCNQDCLTETAGAEPSECVSHEV